VLDVFIAQQRLNLPQTQRPGVDTGDILCEGLHLPGGGAAYALRPYAWDSLMPASLAGQAPCAAPTKPPDSPIATLGINDDAGHHCFCPL